MSVLVYIEHAEGSVKKTSLEAISYAKALSDKLSLGEVIAVALGAISTDELSKAGPAGASKVIHVGDQKLNDGIIQAHAEAVAQVYKKVGASTLVLAKSSLGDAVAARLAIKLDAGLVSNVVELPDATSGYKVKRSIYTGKAFAETMVNTENKILAVKKNAVDLKTDGPAVAVEEVLAEIDRPAIDRDRDLAGESHGEAGGGDDRVVPAHSLKYLATLQAAQIGHKPRFLRVEQNAGHGDGSPTEKIIEEYADRWSFAAHWTGLQVTALP